MNQIPLTTDAYGNLIDQQHLTTTTNTNNNSSQPTIMMTPNGANSITTTATMNSPTTSNSIHHNQQHHNQQHQYQQQQQHQQQHLHTTNGGNTPIMGSPIMGGSNNTIAVTSGTMMGSPTTLSQTLSQTHPHQQQLQQQHQYGCIGYDSPKLQVMNPIFQMDMKTHPLFFNANPLLLEGLSKPAISPYLNFGSLNGYLCLMGTENQSVAKNSLILSRIENNYCNVLKVEHIDEHLRYLEWLPKDPRRIIIAANGELGIVVLSEDMNDISVIDIFPKFHHDTIRQFAINPVNHSLVISGGFDEKVFVTDISRLVDDMEANQQRSENSVYLCQDVVSCVRFHPSDSNVASATTDQGVLHVFDVRTGNTSKPAFVYDTSKYDLFTHVYLDDFTVCLGYGDGSIQVHDIRTGKTLISFIDKGVHSVGDFVYEPEKKLLISLGMNKFSAYQVNPTNFELIHSSYQQIPSITNGNYMSEINQFITTDSFGFVSLYDL